MFKKLKDKLAEEVKSSPQRIQQFAQAAQAAVTSASSSISDITNSDLFSIGDNDVQHSRPKAQSSPKLQENTFQDVTLIQPGSSTSNMDHLDYSGHDIVENQRQRRLSNSSFASDVSFRLPSYETPSMYHLQSDMEVSASEAEERGLSGSTVSLDRVTKEQLYAAYKRTQDRYTKYRTQYADLARHYKLLERENAKARSVLVETQDKALRRISELREQCTLEQSAKAHLEKALRIEIEERNIKIDTLNTKVALLQNNGQLASENQRNDNKETANNENEAQLINLDDNLDNKQTKDATITVDVTTLNNKIEKLEHLVNKYKESLKSCKEKNSQYTTELQILSSELENKNKEIEQLKVTSTHLTQAENQVQELKNINEELQNKINSFDFSKSKEMSTLEIDLQRAQEEIKQLHSQIEVFCKREEENAISLAENKLSIHKELETKEAEIRSLKESLQANKKEIQSMNIVIDDYKSNISMLEEERLKNNININELNSSKSKITDLEIQIRDLTQSLQSLEQLKAKQEEEYKCLHLQMKQETAERLAMIDRNTYLESRNSQLTEENLKKSTHLNTLESEYQVLMKKQSGDYSEILKIQEEAYIWKDKCTKLESEIQEEKEELVKLQSEIEKLLTNYETIQSQNTNLQVLISDLQSQNDDLHRKISNIPNLKLNMKLIASNTHELRESINVASEEFKLVNHNNIEIVSTLKLAINSLLNISHNEIATVKNKYDELEKQYLNLQRESSTVIEECKQQNKKMEVLLEQNNNLERIIQSHETEQSKIDENLKNADMKYDIINQDLIASMDENTNLKTEIKELTTKCNNFESMLEHEKSVHSTMSDKLNLLHEENQNLVAQLKSREEFNLELNEKLNKAVANCNTTMEELRLIKDANAILTDKIKNYDDKTAYICKLEKDISILTQENNTLKNQSEKFTDNVMALEHEINEVRKSHTEIELEKDRLSAIIDKLENNERNKLQSVSVENDRFIENKSIHSLDATVNTDSANASKTQENDNCIVGSDSIQIKNCQYKDGDDILNAVKTCGECDSLKINYEILKEENRRLLSDIEGLQTYLTKISKENSVLNDKLREFIATSENLDKSEDPKDVSELQMEIQSSKDKINDLTRENTLLAEENLELKDQLTSQNYVNDKMPFENEKELTALKEKYKNMLDTKNVLEVRLNDLEQMNRSVNNNMNHMQHNNEKLKLSNEKLERRLDEALVSLRHLHSLQENTELEYLRNILYEYLTGSGAHSVTLAKVLAAIVKFDEMQTQLVLQKEKERQGFLRQLGLL